MKKKISVNELLGKVYEYYPRNIDCIQEKKEYITSKEHNKLLKKISEHKIEHHSQEKKQFITSLSDKCDNNIVFNDSTYFEWLDRCYTFEFSENRGDFVFLLKAFQSILVPVYTIKFFKLETSKEKTRFLEIGENEFTNSSLTNGVKSIFESIGYTEFKESLISKKIIDVNFDDISMENFTFFNAFFNSQNF